MYKDIDRKMVRRIRKKQYKRCKIHQRGGFLNRYDFAYAVSNTVNQAMKGIDALAPEKIKQATDQFDPITQRYIQEIINQGEQQVEKIAPKNKGCNRRGI